MKSCTVLAIVGLSADPEFNVSNRNTDFICTLLFQKKETLISGKINSMF